LEVHHIVAICVDPDLAFDPNNLLTLCRKCHFKTHNFGNKAKK
jgi:5-methylcytosine-specific restriction endonuclease McrA